MLLLLSFGLLRVGQRSFVFQDKVYIFSIKTVESNDPLTKHGHFAIIQFGGANFVNLVNDFRIGLRILFSRPERLIFYRSKSESFGFSFFSDTNNNLCRVNSVFILDDIHNEAFCISQTEPLTIKLNYLNIVVTPSSRMSIEVLKTAYKDKYLCDPTNLRCEHDSFFVIAEDLKKIEPILNCRQGIQSFDESIYLSSISNFGAVADLGVLNTLYHCLENRHSPVSLHLVSIMIENFRQKRSFYILETDDLLNRLSWIQDLF